MTISRPIVCVLYCVMSFAGCTTGEPFDVAGSGGFSGGFGGTGGSSGDPDGGRPDARLQIDSASAVMLRPDQRAEIVVRLVNDNGAPIPNTQVSYTLVGRAQDSGLSRLTTMTDGAGQATTTLIAGKQAASFQVRVSAGNAQPVTIDAAVSDRGFGNLRVSAPYAGDRLVTQRRVALFAGATCGELGMATTPDRQSNLALPTEDARFIGLPAESAYAVLVLGFGAPSIALAQGCADHVTIVADVETTIELTLTDRALVPWGDYVLDASLNAQMVSSELQAQVRAHAMQRPPGQVSALSDQLLNALDEALRMDPQALPQIAAADALVQLRELGADHDLQAELDSVDVGTSTAQAWLADQLEEELAVIKLRVDLRLENDDEQMSEMTWTLREVGAARSLESSTSTSLSITDLSSSQSQPTFVWSRDQMTANGSVPSAFGGLAVEVIDAALDGTSDARAHVRDLLGCPTLRAWVDDQPALAVACDTTCVESACERLQAAWLASLQAALVALDAARPVTNVGATFSMIDTSADGDVDALSTDACMATWEPVEGGVDVGSYMVGSAHAERVAVLP